MGCFQEEECSSLGNFEVAIVSFTGTRGFSTLHALLLQHTPKEIP
jgi:hypothetical protein